MSEHPHSASEKNHFDPALKVQEGLELAQAQGFDFDLAVRNGLANNLDPSQVVERQAAVLATAAEIVGDIELDPDFLRRPANTILLLGIAESWNQSEQSPKERSRERAMLVDVALMAAGSSSKFVTSLPPQEAKRYLSDHVVSPQEAKCREFYENINDAELADKVYDLIKVESEGSLMHGQREMLGLTATTEDIFEVKVLKVGPKYYLEKAGVLPPVEWPDDSSDDATEEERLITTQLREQAYVAIDEQARLYKEYDDNQQAYDLQFAKQYGDIPEAFVSREKDGTITLYMRAAQAAMLVREAERGTNFDAQTSDSDVNIAIATVRHEYTHTQRNLAMGERMQLGLMLEERKAELVSHDKLGYLDVKNYVNDMGMAHSVYLTDALESALKQDDALSAYLSWSANTLGLRNTLLTMASKPLPYNNSPTASERFADIDSLRDRNDDSPHDAIMRENLNLDEKRENYKARAANWAGKVLSRENADVEFLTGFYINYRSSHGAQLTSQYLNAALKEKLSESDEEGTI